jgi:hypothetical protein
MPKVILIDDDYSTEILVENLSFRGFDARRINSMVAAINCIDEIVAAELVILDIIMERPTDAPPKSRATNTACGSWIRFALRAPRNDGEAS